MKIIKLLLDRRNLNSSDSFLDVKTFKLQLRTAKDKWVTLTNYTGLSEHKAKFYEKICTFSKNFVPYYKEIRAVND